MIAVRLQGRLGNQLFQYAFACTASKKIGTGFYLDQYLEKSLVHQYFQIEVKTVEAISLALFNINGYKNFFNHYTRRQLNKCAAYFYRFKKKEYGYALDQSVVEVEDHTLYIRYFQSLLLLRPFENMIRQKLTIKTEISQAFKDRFSELYRANTIVTVHVRRTDYKNLGHLNLGGDDLSLPLKYYQTALSTVAGKNLHYIFISDDTAFVEANFAGIQPKTISVENEICDFQHLLNADICITSNSSFSWWGAWLNEKESKVVYCPKYYVGFHLKKEIPLNIYPKEWRQIGFNE